MKNSKQILMECIVTVLFAPKLADINVVSRTEGQIVTANGKEYVKLTHFDVDPQFGDLKIFATGLFPDPELSKCNNRTTETAIKIEKC